VTVTPDRELRLALPRALVMLLGGAGVVVTMAGVHAARGILGPLFLALVMTILVHPVRHRLQRRLPGWFASVVCILLVTGIIVGIALAVVVAIARFGSLLPAYKDDLAAEVDKATAWLHDLGIDGDQVRHLTSGFDLSRLLDLVASALSGVLASASSLAFILALCLFMTVDGRTFPVQLRTVAERRPDLIAALGHFAQSTRRYLWVSTVFGLAVAALDTVALYLFGVPAPLLWGLLAFLTNYIPNVGFVIGLVPPAILALLDSGPGLMLAVVLVYTVLNLIIQSVIQPKVVGDAVGLSTTLTFLSLVFWSWIIGPVGAVLAVPLTLLAQALLVDADPSSRWLVPLIANRADEPAAPNAGHRGG
jgi:AI-2 transport protein TqsA